MDEFFTLLGGIFTLLSHRAGAAILGILLLAGTLFGIGYHYWNKPVRETRAIVTLQSHIACHPEVEVPPMKTDYWDRDIKTKSVKDGNGSIFCTASSAGRDGIFETEDDIIALYKDVNMSRIAGAWMKTKGAEAIKGMFFGDRSNETEQQKEER